MPHQAGDRGEDHPATVEPVRTLRHGFRLRTHLLALLLVPLIPGIAICCAVALHASNGYSSSFEARLRDTAEALSLFVDSEIGRTQAALRGLTASAALDPRASPERLAAFHFRAKEAIDGIARDLFVVEPAEGNQQILNTARPFGESLPAASSVPDMAEAVQRAFEEQRVQVGGLGLSPLAGRHLYSVALPVVRDGRSVRVLGASVDPAELAGRLAEQSLSRDSVVTVLDANHVIVARSRGHENSVGQAAPTWITEALLGRSEGMVSRTLANGHDAVIAFSDVPRAPGWRILVSVPEGTLYSGWSDPVYSLVAAGLFALALGAVLSVGIWHRLLTPLSQLSTAAKAVAAGRPAPPFPAMSGLFPAVREFEELREDVLAAEAALRTARDEAFETLESISDCFYAIDADWRFVYLNRSALEVLGVRAEAVLGKRMFDIYPDIEGSISHVHLRRAMNEREPKHFESISPELGNWASYAAFPRKDGGLSVYLRDLSGQKAREAALRASEERLRLALDGTGMGTWDKDLETRWTTWSRHLFRMLGYPIVEDGQADMDMWRRLVHPDDLAALMEDWDRARRQGTDFRSTHRIHRADDASIRWIEAHGRVLHGQAASGSGRFVGVMIDVTDRREGEERGAVLAREVDHRAKNVLSVVQAVLRLTPASDAASFVQIVEGRVGALARAHTHLANARWLGADLRDVLADEVTPAIKELRVSLEGPGISLAAGAVQPLALAIHELFTNAQRHGALSVPGGQISIVWSVLEDTGLLRLSWLESGGPRIAEPQDRKGFGFTLMNMSVKGQLSGKVTLDWRRNGLACHIDIGKALFERRGMIPSHPLPRPTAQGGSTLGGCRVLLVEDEPLVAMAMATLLTQQGCKVFGPAETLDDALRLTSERISDIDVALLDVNLRGTYSFPVADVLNEAGVPFIYATGYGELPEGRGPDAAGILRKPVSATVLIDALSQAIAQVSDDDLPAEG